MNNNILKEREIISFNGRCPFNCKHCYTFGDNEEDKKINDSEV